MIIKIQIMITRVKKWFNCHLIKKTIPIYVVCSMILISFITTVLIFYKSPISLKNHNDMDMVNKMIIDQKIKGKIESIELKEGVIYVGLRDSIFKLSDNIKTDADILWKTRVLKYTVSNDTDTIKCITIFEVDEKFLKDKVGKHLITIKNVK